jgi:hypothetical protein
LLRYDFDETEETKENGSAEEYEDFAGTIRELLL